MKKKQARTDTAKEAKEAAEAQMHRLAENCTPVKVLRSQIKFATYNPRKMTEDARKRLGSGIERFGLVDIPTWNKRTGNLVGGHQRVKKLDATAGGKDYFLWVVEVDLDDKAERELNILLNNPEAQGEYDLEKLKELFFSKEIPLEPENAGVSMADMFSLFGESNVIEDKTAEDLQKMSDDLKSAHETYDKIRDGTNAQNDPDFYIVVVFRSHEECKSFTDAAGLPDEKYVNGDILRKRL
jgi:hypothetical protein